MDQSPPTKDAKDRLLQWVSLAIGVVIFVKFALADPVFDNLLLDIPLYLAIGLASIVLFLLTFWLAAAMAGRQKIMRGDRITAVGYCLGAFSFAVAGGGAYAAMQALQHWL